MIKNISFALLYICTINLLWSQESDYSIKGQITDGSSPIPLAIIEIEQPHSFYYTDIDGYYHIALKAGTYTIRYSATGHRSITKTIEITTQKTTNIDIQLAPDPLGLDEIVVSATRNRVERKKSPVIVSSIKTQVLNASQSTSLADGLNYAPGARIEANCQNCGFTQVRLNGLEGAYTQILLNSRPVFSSLLGVYGLEQIPVNTIDRIEIVRSGGSALYGSNAIAGTVNVITKDPILNQWELGSNIALIKGKAIDRNVNFNTTLVADDLMSGVSVYGSYRNRDDYDANDDDYTEIVELNNNTLGAKSFYKPNDRSRIALNLNAIKEYRRGGNKLDLAPHFTDITEQVEHNTFVGALEYELNSKDYNQKTQVYSSAAHTDRDSYYGGLDGGTTSQDSLLAYNAYGVTKDLAWVTGAQYTKNLNNNDIITTGVEYNISDTQDEIKGYNRLIDQRVNSLGTYVQYEWKPSLKLTTLLGARYDHIKVDGIYTIGDINRKVKLSQGVVSPRLSIAYDLVKDVKLRAGYARGFRAPQAFNEELHVSSVGGEQLFVTLSENLETEYSNAFTASLNYAISKKLLQMDLLIEGFYTRLENPFTQVSTGASLPNGSILEELRNGSAASVYGTNIEIGVSPNTKWRFQLGATYQQSRYQQDQLLYESDGTAGENDIFIDSFTRTPNLYGYFNASWIPSDQFNIDLTSTFTGSMTVPRIISNTGFLELNKTPSFYDLNIKFEKHFHIKQDFQIILSTGVRNLFDSYQRDFETGPNRDSTYIYGPINPRTIFLGLKIGSGD